MITSSCVKLMEWCFKSLGGVVNHATLQKTHTQTILLATGRNYPYTKHNWAFHILLRSITFPLVRDFWDCLPGSPRSFSSNFSHLCLSAADVTTSFQRHKWPHTKMHTNSDIIFMAQFLMLFHMMWSILFRMFCPKFLIGCLRTLTNEKVVSWPNTPNKMNHTMWKSMKSCAHKWCCKLCAILFRSLVPFERCVTFATTSWRGRHKSKKGKHGDHLLKSYF